MPKNPSDQTVTPLISKKKQNLGKSGQNKSPVFANGEGRCNSFLKILNCEGVFVAPSIKKMKSLTRSLVGLLVVHLDEFCLYEYYNELFV